MDTGETALQSSLAQQKLNVTGDCSMTADPISCFCQDELEFGYVDSPHQRFPVVLDSPRDGKIMDFPYKKLLVSDTINSFLQK